ATQEEAQRENRSDQVSRELKGAAMLAAIIDHLWQSTLIVLAAAAATFALRRYSARWRYWIWVAASMKFLVPFAALTWLGAQFAWRAPPPVPEQSEWRSFAASALQPMNARALSARPAQPAEPAHAASVPPA